MTSEIDTLICGDEAARLLPWFVAGALTPEESGRVQAHLLECALCAADERRERCLRSLISGDEPAVEHAPQPGLQKLMSRIDEFEQGLQTDPAGLPSSGAEQRFTRGRWVRWLAAAVVIQAIGLGVLGAWLWQKSWLLQAPRFSTLSSSTLADTDVPQVRVVFAPGTTIEDIQQLLGPLQATVAAGPSDAGVYTLALADRKSSVAGAVKQLRANPKVLFAEPGAPPADVR